MTWKLDIEKANRDKAALEARILDKMHVGQAVAFGWHGEIAVERTDSGYIVNGTALTRAAALADIGAYVSDGSGRLVKQEVA
jgi:hypothetical protein